VPTVIQMEAVECGAASLAMILGHYGRHVPLEELRVVCGVSRDGAVAANLLRAGRRYGLVGRGFQLELDDLRTKVRTPAIVFWRFSHYLVVEGFHTRRGRTTVAVNDPSGGPRRMDRAEFDNGFTGVALTFEPGPDFRPGGEPTRLGPALLARRMPTGQALPLVLLASLLLVAPGLAGPAYLRVFIDRVLTGPAGGMPWWLLAAVAVTVAVTAVLSSVQRHYLLRIETRLGLLGAARFFRHLLRLPVSFFAHRQPAEISRRVAVNDQVAEVLSRDVAATVVNLLLVGFYGVVLLRYDVPLGVIGIAMAALNIAVLRRVARLRTDAVAAVRAERGKLTATTFQTLNLIESVKAAGAEPEAFGRWAGYLAKVVGGRQRLGVTTAVLSAVPPLLAGVNSGLILLVGGLRVVDGAITAGMLVAFQTLLAQLSRPVTQLTNLGQRLQELSADVVRLHDVERHPVAAAFARPAEPVPTRLDGRLTFAGVTFGYGPLARPVLHDVSLELVPGRRLAVVGGSGSGKSTVGRLAAGLYEPSGGAVLLDGWPLASIPRLTLAATLGYVEQEPTLFEGTVRDNLTLWNDAVPDAVLLAALADAALLDEVTARAGGLASPVSEGGRNLSGGQRQRLELARALVGGPTLLILDEATSSLDQQTESVIADNLRRRGCACLIIAHRLATIRDADEIVVLDKGVAVERGRHQDLLAAGGQYARLVAGDADAPPPALPAGPTQPGPTQPGPTQPGPTQPGPTRAGPAAWPDPMRPDLSAYRTNGPT
jgi:NHLM bacteriocin system ABC transporter peptidase/ATP-binding protein